MPDENQEVERVRQARRILDRMRGRLLQPNPEALVGSAADLSRAVDCLQELDISLKSPIWRERDRRKVETEVVALRHAVRSVEELLVNAGKFYAGLSRLMAPDEAPAHYTASGASSAPARVAEVTVVVHG